MPCKTRVKDLWRILDISSTTFIYTDCSQLCRLEQDPIPTLVINPLVSETELDFYPQMDFAQPALRVTARRIHGGWKQCRSFRPLPFRCTEFKSIYSMHTKSVAVSELKFSSIWLWRWLNLTFRFDISRKLL
jgi:hypothetical protein